MQWEYLQSQRTLNGSKIYDTMISFIIGGVQNKANSSKQLHLPV